jgi:NAD(P)-dependent dehydrogenase (short-subunit alcohol dehydrogenase family)
MSGSARSSRKAPSSTPRPSGGAIDTELGGGMMRTDEVRALAAQQIALGRMGQPDDLAAAVPAILSGAFAWATGALIEVSEGQDL